MSSFLNDVSDETRQEIEELNQEIAALKEKIEAAEKEASQLLEREARGEGVFASRIFELKQNKMMLMTEIQHRKVRINHLLINPEPRENQKNG
jgi:cellobiose-specific phosphotransferase system component IIA